MTYTVFGEGALDFTELNEDFRRVFETLGITAINNSLSDARGQAGQGYVYPGTSQIFNENFDGDAALFEGGYFPDNYEKIGVFHYEDDSTTAYNFDGLRIYSSVEVGNIVNPRNGEDGQRLNLILRDENETLRARHGQTWSDQYVEDIYYEVIHIPDEDMDDQLIEVQTFNGTSWVTQETLVNNPSGFLTNSETYTGTITVQGNIQGVRTSYRGRQDNDFSVAGETVISYFLVNLGNAVPKIFREEVKPEDTGKNAYFVTNRYANYNDVDTVEARIETRTQAVNTTTTSANNILTDFELILSPDERYVVMPNISANQIQMYEMSTPGDVSTLSTSPVSTISLSGPQEVTYGDDGNLLIAYNGTNTLQYELSTPYDIGTAGSSTTFSTTGARMDLVQHILWNEDGTQCYMLSLGRGARLHDASTAFDPTSLSFNKNIVMPDDLRVPQWVDNGNQVAGETYIYDLDTPYDLETVTRKRTHLGQFYINPTTSYSINGSNDALLKITSTLPYGEPTDWTSSDDWTELDPSAFLQPTTTPEDEVAIAYRLTKNGGDRKSTLLTGSYYRVFE